VAHALRYLVTGRSNQACLLTDSKDLIKLWKERPTTAAARYVAAMRSSHLQIKWNR
jgi:hypothetical protein